MKSSQIVKHIHDKCRKGASFISFDYDKKDGTQPKRRNVLFNVQIEKAQEKRGEPLTGKGNWHSGMQGGKNGLVIKRGKDYYVRGYEAGKVLKIFNLSFPNFKNFGSLSISERC